MYLQCWEIAELCLEGTSFETILVISSSMWVIYKLSFIQVVRLVIILPS